MFVCFEVPSESTVLPELRTKVLVVDEALGENLDPSVGHWLIMSQAASLCSMFFICEMGIIIVRISRFVKIK